MTDLQPDFWRPPWLAGDESATRSSRHLGLLMRRNVALECGWGRLIFGHTFDSHAALRDVLRAEARGQRDIAMYLPNPQVLVASAPEQFFIDPSYTFRLPLHRYEPARELVRRIRVRAMASAEDAQAVNRLYAKCQMVLAPPEVMAANQRTRSFTYLVAESEETGDIVGTVTGIDHVLAFSDPEAGASLWCLAVNPQCGIPGVGEALVRRLIEGYKARRRTYLDLSVMHDNRPAIALYRKLRFVPVPVFAVKRKNPINERFFSAPPSAAEEGLNPYARLIAEEARRRGISVEVVDAEGGFLRLSHGGRQIVTRESLSELTTAVAMSRCDDKRVTRRAMERAGLRVPLGRTATFDDEDAAFLAEVGEVVVKPARGEQGRGITVGVRDPEHLARAAELARSFSFEVLIEECVSGEDLRVIVIDHEVVAAAVRRPATVVGTGRHAVRDLIEVQSRRRAAATGGESRIPLDETTIDTIAGAGYTLDDVLAEGEVLRVRRTANLHTGGTIHDVTARLHPTLAEAAVRASYALDIPVVGMDLMVSDVEAPEYVVIEANERPGLANHEPQPTAQRFIDLLFPGTHQRLRRVGPGRTARPLP